VLTLEWIDGHQAHRSRGAGRGGPRPQGAGAILVRAFLRQAVVDGFFHADLHQGNLFALPDGPARRDRLRIMGRIDRQARLWLAEILYGLITAITGASPRIHFEAQYVPGHHNVDEFATALRASASRSGAAVKDISIGRMLDGPVHITRDFDMPTQPHLLLLQKTMVMEEGVATALDPDINMWETASPSCANGCAANSAPRRAWPTRSCATSARCAACPNSSAAGLLLSAAGRRAADAAARRRGRAPAAPDWRAPAHRRSWPRLRAWRVHFYSFDERGPCA
jgi:ubiquinone biosynthesis protein